MLSATRGYPGTSIYFVYLVWIGGLDSEIMTNNNTKQDTEQYHNRSKVVTW